MPVPSWQCWVLNRLAVHSLGPMSGLGGVCALLSLASSIFFPASASFLRGKGRQAPPGMGRSLRLRAQAAQEGCGDWHHIAICPAHWVGCQF